MINNSSIVETGLQHIFPHFYTFSTFFHIFPSLSLHFPKSCHKFQCSKEKMRLPKTLLMDTLIRMPVLHLSLVLITSLTL